MLFAPTNKYGSSTRRRLAAAATWALMLMGSGTITASTLPIEAARLANAGLFSRALPLIEPLAKTNPDDIELQFHLGEALLGSGRVDEAVAVLARVAQAAPDHGRYRRVLGEAYRDQAQQRFDRGASVFAMVRIMGVMRSARTEFEAAVRLEPQDLKALVNLATFHIVAPGVVGGDRDTAHALQARIDQIDPVQGLRVRAQEAEQNKNPARAEALLREAVARDDGVESCLALGLLLANEKRFEEAITVFEEIGAGDDQPYLGWYQLGRVADMSQTNVEHGIAMLQRYLAIDDLPDAAPSKGWAHYRLGNLHALRGHRDLAQAQYRAAQRYTSTEPALQARIADGAGASE